MKNNTINIMGQLADLKDINYSKTLAISTLIELLIERGIFTREEFSHKARELDLATIAEISLQHKKLHAVEKS